MVNIQDKEQKIKIAYIPNLAHSPQLLLCLALWYELDLNSLIKASIQLKIEPLNLG